MPIEFECIQQISAITVQTNPVDNERDKVRSVKSWIIICIAHLRNGFGGCRTGGLKLGHHSDRDQHTVLYPRHRNL